MKRYELINAYQVNDETNRTPNIGNPDSYS